MDDELADLEKEFDRNENSKKQNPLGNSITKEILQQSKKDIGSNFNLNDDDYQFDDRKKQGGTKKNLEIEIDDNADYD